MDKKFVRRTVFVKVERTENLEQDTMFYQHGPIKGEHLFKKGSNVSSIYYVKAMVGFPQGVSIEEVESTCVKVEKTLKNLFVANGDSAVGELSSTNKIKLEEGSMPFEFVDVKKYSNATLSDGMCGKWIYSTGEQDLLKPKTDGVGVN